MAKLKDLGEIRQIEVEGSWTMRPDLGNLDATKRIVSQYRFGETSLWLFHAEEKVPLSAASGASIWQIFSSAKSPKEQNRQLMPSDLRKLSELLKGRNDEKQFVLCSARLRLLAGRVVLHVQGTEVITQTEHNCIIVPKRTPSGWSSQELGFRFDGSWHKKVPLESKHSFGKLIAAAWNTIEWNQSMPPLYVPSKLAPPVVAHSSPFQHMAGALPV